MQVLRLKIRDMKTVLRITLTLVLLVPAVAFSSSRIASLNLCLDQVLLRWVPPQSIVSVTWLSAQEQYRRAPVPEHVYLNRAQAEELLPLRPDLVLTGEYGAQRAASRLQQLGLRVVRIPDAYSLEQLQAQLASLVATLGPLPGLKQQQERLHRLLPGSTAAAPDTIQKTTPTALILSANNITYGSGMLEHQLLSRAGFANLAAERGVKQLGRVSLEQVIDAEPDLLVLYGGEQNFAIAHLAERHPVLLRYLNSGRVYRLPQELGFCPALAAADVLQQLIEKRREIVDAG